MTGTAVTWMSVADAALGEGDGDGPAGISEAEGATDSVGVGDSGAEVAGTRASGKHALAVTTTVTRTTTNTWP